MQVGRGRVIVIAEAGPYALNVCGAVQWYLKHTLSNVTSKDTLKSCTKEIGHVRQGGE